MSKIHWIPHTLLIFLFASLVCTACTSIRPVGKIGLLAPFEGLERRAGYDALAAMRAALRAAPSQAALLPAALDVSRDVRRASQKLVASGQTLSGNRTLLAVIGPLTPQAAYVISDVIASTHTPWVLPFALTSAGFTSLDDPNWVAESIAPLGLAAQEMGAQRLALAGWTPGWPAQSAAVWRNFGGPPIVFLDEPEDVHSEDAVIWLGAADAGAQFFTALRQSGSVASYWLALGGDNPVFVERSREVVGDAWGDVYWAKWTPAGYSDDPAQRSSASSLSIAIFAATHSAIVHALGEAASDERWQVKLYRLSDAGQSLPLTVGD